ncbi:hypothetical protein BU16DRAFT_588716 [Lophium mytilinum]|uniref:DUF7082 domain-containing protein n=1 Tax=Lophium mytilinum TaxID=390894 RepID=A0A6A6RH99_9PEZI|nr:hypothetical protein BU16DRAFT_588716 [Lophium mytilinum]
MLGAVEFARPCVFAPTPRDSFPHLWILLKFTALRETFRPGGAVRASLPHDNLKPSKYRQAGLHRQCSLSGTCCSHPTRGNAALRPIHHAAACVAAATTKLPANLVSGPQPERSVKAPFIVGEDCDSTESLLLQCGQDYESGPLTLSGLSATLSMSSYEKSQEPYLYDAAATRPNQDPSYASFTQPFASQYTDAQARASHEPSSVEMPYIPISGYESRGSSSYPAAFPFIDASSRSLQLPGPPPEITSYHPTKGVAGEKFTINLRSRWELTSQTNIYFYTIMFGTKRCETSQMKVTQSDNYYFYSTTTEIPSPPLSTNSLLDNQVRLQMKIEDAYGREYDVVEVGDFTYSDLAASYNSYNPVQDVPRKRKYSGESEDYIRPEPKRISSQRLYSKPRETAGGYATGHGSPSPVTPYLQPSLPSGLYSTGYERVQPQQTQSYIHPGGMNYSQNIKAQSPNMPSYSPYSTVTQPRRSPASLAATPARTPAMPSPASLANPQLIRTSTIQVPSNRGTPGPSHPQAFNPYLMYPNSKAILKIDGDLEKMGDLDKWSLDERDTKRRLVQFRRSQSGSTITTTFEPVSPEQRSPNSICVSCIWWEEKNECYITSVDTIFLLESLVGVRFTVEEKNRIRRNLEGFRPATVSKTKVDSEEFFKVIMGFPNPKPRNIEKDVKVFPWKILAHALKKIISKYSASYSSTAGALESNDLHRNTSPRSVASSSGPLAYATGLPLAKLHSPKSKASAGLGVSGGLPTELPVSVPQLAPSLQGLSPWPASAHLPVAHAAPNFPYSTGRSAWEYGGYLDSPASAPLPTTQSLQRPGSASDAGHAPGSEAYQRYGQRTSHA